MATIGTLDGCFSNTLMIFCFTFVLGTIFRQVLHLRLLGLVHLLLILQISITISASEEVQATVTFVTLHLIQQLIQPVLVQGNVNSSQAYEVGMFNQPTLLFYIQPQHNYRYSCTRWTRHRLHNRLHRGNSSFDCSIIAGSQPNRAYFQSLYLTSLSLCLYATNTFQIPSVTTEAIAKAQIGLSTLANAASVQGRICGRFLTITDVGTAHKTVCCKYII